MQATPAALRTARDEVRAWLDALGVDALTAYDIVFGLNEALANAIEHAVEPAEPHVEIEGRMVEGAIVLSVRDTGGWRPASRNLERGRGFQLMRATADEVRLNMSTHGTEVTLVRRLDGVT